MALKPSARYPGQIDTSDAAYPHGKARNAGSFQDGTGTPLEKDWINDLFGLQQALLAEANLVPSEVPDAVGESQYLDAIRDAAWREDERSLRDDFSGARAEFPDASNVIVYSRAAWQASIVNAPALTIASGTAKNPGQVVATLSPGLNRSFQFFPANAVAYPANTFRRARFCASVSLAVDSEISMGFGLFGAGGTASPDHIQIMHDSTVGGWRLLVRKAGIDAAPVAVGTVTSSAFADWELFRMPNGDLQIRILESPLVVAHTLAFADQPTALCAPGFYGANLAGNSNPVACALDLIDVGGARGVRGF